MRRAIVLAILLAAPAGVHADKRIQDLTPLFVTEASGCEVQTSGLVKVATGAAELARTLAGAEREDLERDVDKLTSGIAAFKGYCGEVGAMVAFLREHAQSAYRSVEREIDARDNKLRKLRRDAKQLIAELQPITRKLIPRIAGRGHAAADERRTPGTFPSRRTVDLPSLPGSWRLSGSAASDTAEYTDKAATASVTARAFASSTCEEQRKLVAARAGDALTTLEVASDSGVLWHVRYIRRDKTDRPGARLASAMCAETKAGGVLATAEVAPADRTAVVDEISKLMLRMIAAQLTARPAP